MAASLSGIVNQHVFHAKLLCEMVDELGEQVAFRKVKVQALESSAVSALFRAYQAFLMEVADSCKLKATITDLAHFEQLLTSEGRSHAVVNSLRVLLDKPGWLSALLNAYAALLTDPAPASAAEISSNAHLITLADVSEVIEVPQMIHQFEAFVSEQREFLQEW